MSESAYLTAEAKARVEIDKMLEAAGWIVQDVSRVNLYGGPGVAVREFVMAKGFGRADYLLFVDGQAVGHLEAKPEGDTLTEVEIQSAKYSDGLPEALKTPIEPLPFAYESTGVETRFTNRLDPEPRSRELFAIHRPETLRGWIQEALDAEKSGAAPTLRGRILELPPLDERPLRSAQVEAIKNLEFSLSQNRPKSLIQMTTGAGKTFAAVTESYRLVKFAKATRILFLVDRANLGRQALTEFQQMVTPDDGRKFTELYNVQLLQSNRIDPAARVVITTIQRLYSILKGEEELDPELEERSLYEYEPPAPVQVSYSAAIPVETFDFAVIDECHRSIYGVWRQVLDYFDVFKIGLTATPSKQTLGFFDQNLVTEYNHERAVADGVNVDFDVYRIRTKITGTGSTIDAGLVTGFRNRETRKVRWEKAEEEITYGSEALDRRVVARDQIRTIIRAFKERLFTEIFPGRTEIPKTLIYAKDDSHADDIVQIVREEFGRGNEFAAKITYRTTGHKPDDLLRAFKNAYNPRIVVTVDMIATGIDIKPLECVFFMRSVKSRTYFEQMKGRGVRVINEADFRAVTPDATAKTHFVIVDAVGVTDTPLMDTQPLDREPTVPLDRLLNQVAIGNHDIEVVSTLAARLARLDRQVTAEDREELRGVAAGQDLKEIVQALVAAVDPDEHVAKAQAATGREEPPAEAVAKAADEMIAAAVRPLASNPDFRQKILDVRRSYEQVIDETSKDELVGAGHSVDAADRARTTVTDFRKFIDEHKDSIAALQILYSPPYRRRLTFKEIKELASAIGRPPHQWTPERLWKAYEQLDRSKVRGSGGKMLTDIVSLVRFALEQDGQLVPFKDLVDRRFRNWLDQQEQAGHTFTSEQVQWLQRIRDHLATSLAITPDDFEYTPFVEHGGLGRAYAVFGDQLNPLLEQLTEALGA